MSLQEKRGDTSVIAFAIIKTIITGVIGAFLGAVLEFPNLGIIVAIAVMGGFIIDALGIEAKIKAGRCIMLQYKILR